MLVFFKRKIMTISTIEQVLPIFLKNPKCAALDLGTKTIGLSVCDYLGKFSHPRPFIKRKKFKDDSKKLLNFFDQENIQFIIIGFPMNMNGSLGPRAQATRSFIKNMEKITELPFILWDERLTTVAATRQLIEMDVSRKKRTEKIDSMSACFILESALARLNNLKNLHQNQS